MEDTPDILFETLCNVLTLLRNTWFRTNKKHYSAIVYIATPPRLFRYFIPALSIRYGSPATILFYFIYYVDRFAAGKYKEQRIDTQAWSKCCRAETTSTLAARRWQKFCAVPSRMMLRVRSTWRLHLVPRPEYLPHASEAPLFLTQQRLEFSSKCLHRSDYTP